MNKELKKCLTQGCPFNANYNKWCYDHWLEQQNIERDKFQAFFISGYGYCFACKETKDAFILTHIMGNELIKLCVDCAGRLAGKISSAIGEKHKLASCGHTVPQNLICGYCGKCKPGLIYKNTLEYGVVHTDNDFQTPGCCIGVCEGKLD